MRTFAPIPDDLQTQQLLILLTAHVGLPDLSKLSLSTSINHDLHCDGDDAAEFMASLAERFAIDFIDYDAYRYFNPEGYDLLKWRRPKHRRGSIPLTLAMLHHAIETRRWNTAELEALNA
jgi:hypothetical protein